MLRSAFIFLSQQRGLRRWMENSSFAKPLTRRFIAGNTLEEALAACQKIHQQGILITLDYLGESVRERQAAIASRDSCLAALRRIGELALPATVSIKVTQIGLDIDEGLCYENARTLVEAAKQIGSRVEFDMESSDYVDRTLRIVERLHGEFGCVRAVIQAYLMRSEADIADLNRRQLPVRLCKGAYAEPPERAYQEKADVDGNYVKLAQQLLEGGAYPAIATHDDNMIAPARPFAKDSFEYQMLYGVRRDLQQRLVREGYRVRVYVPYGEAWYPYFMRRLAERPANVWFILRSMIGG